MSFFLFMSTLLISVCVVTVAMLYLRHTTRRVIGELCQSDSGAEFWLRSADIMAYGGALILVLLFGEAQDPNDWVQTIRLTLILTLSGIVFTVMFVAKNVWQTVNQHIASAANQPT